MKNRVRTLTLAFLFLAVSVRAQTPATPDQLAEQVQALFQGRCAECHFPTAKTVGGKLDYLNDLERLAKNTKLVNTE